MRLTRRLAQLGGLLVAAWLVYSPQVMAVNPGDKPSLVLPDLDGKTRRLAEWNGKVLLVNFWATWCSPCQAEVPSLMRYQKQYGTKGLQIIGVGMDEAVKLRNFRNTFDLNYPVLVADPERSLDILAEWGNNRGIVPYSVLLDGHGRVLEAMTGVIDDDVMEDLVLPHLKASSAKKPPQH
jgi:peroxiredoxin